MTLESRILAPYTKRETPVGTVVKVIEEEHRLLLLFDDCTYFGVEAQTMWVDKDTFPILTEATLTVDDLLEMDQISSMLYDQWCDEERRYHEALRLQNSKIVAGQNLRAAVDVLGREEVLRRVQES